MNDIIKLINSTKKNTIFSMFAPNGTGKSILCKKINRILCDTEIEIINKQRLTKAFHALSPHQNTMVYNHPIIRNLKKYEPLYLNSFTHSKAGILLPLDISKEMEEKSFSFNLSYTKFIYTSDRMNHPYILFVKEYLELEKNLPLIGSPLTVNKNFFKNSCYFFNSSDIEAETGYIYLNKIEKISTLIEFISSLIKTPVNYLLELCKTKTILQLENFIEKSIIDLYVKTSSQKQAYKNKFGDEYELWQFISKSINQYSLWVKNDKLIEFLLNYSVFNQSNTNELIKKIEDYNFILLKYFTEAKKIFNNFFPDKFIRIELNQRFNSSLCIMIYDIVVTNKTNQTFSSFNFLSNIGSEGEKKLINLIHLIIKIISMDENKKYLITSDDAFDSFDNSNYSNIFKLLTKLLENKSYIYINFMHNYEQFREFNERLNVNNKNIYILGRISNQPITEGSVEYFKLTNFPAKKEDFYLGYLKDKFNNNKHLGVEDQLISLIATIPHYRNVMEIVFGNKSCEYKNSTNFLHLKTVNTRELNFFLDQPIINKFKINKYLLKWYCKKNKKYFPLLTELYKYMSYNILNNKLDQNLLEYRIFIAMYGRMLIEYFIIKELKINVKKDPIETSQTGYLINKFKIYAINKNSNLLNDLLININYLNSYIPDYFHTNYNEIFYLINLDINNLSKGIEQLTNSIKNYKPKLLL